MPDTKPEPKHCDDYIDDPTQPQVLRTFLKRARSPAHGHLIDAPFPRLFADYEGKTYQVIMASRMGDVGITDDLSRKKEYGYSKRVFVEQLTNFRNTP